MERTRTSRQARSSEKQESLGFSRVERQRTSYYYTEQTEETIREFLPEFERDSTEFDSAMLRMRQALARNEELRNLVKVRDERIAELERLLGRYREMARYLCGKWDMCNYCDLDCAGREPCELWKLERELGDKG